MKIGMELFYAEGPQVVRGHQGQGHKIFLDLKLHDIPNTVKRAMSGPLPPGRGHGEPPCRRRLPR